MLYSRSVSCARESVYQPPLQEAVKQWSKPGEVPDTELVGPSNPTPRVHELVGPSNPTSRVHEFKLLPSPNKSAILEYLKSAIEKAGADDKNAAEDYQDRSRSLT